MDWWITVACVGWWVAPKLISRLKTGQNSRKYAVLRGWDAV